MVGSLPRPRSSTAPNPATEAIVVVTKLAKQAGAKRAPDRQWQTLDIRTRRTISPAHSMPMVAPAKPFSSASSEHSHDPITSRKLTPVA